MTVANSDTVSFGSNYVLINSYIVIEGSDTSITVNKVKFSRSGTIFVRENMLVQDSAIQNDGVIIVSGVLYLIGDSVISGQGIIR